MHRMYLETLNDLTSGDPERMIDAYNAVCDHVDHLSELPAGVRGDFGD